MSNVLLNIQTYKNIIFIIGMGHNNNVWAIIPMASHHGRISYKDTLVQMNKIKIVQIKYVIFSDIPN